jgi:putative endopeptidase
MIKACVLVVSIAFAPAFLAFSASAASPLVPQGVHVGDLNRQAQACTDFYEFANGTWRAENPIPAGLPRWSRRVAAHDGNWRRLQNVLEEVSRKKDWPVGSIEQQVGDHYAACMNDAAVNAAGAKPLAPFIAEIDAARTPADVQRIVRRLHDLGIFAAFTTNGEADHQNGNSFIEDIDAGSLGMPDRSYYVGAEPQFVEARAKFKAHVAKILSLGGTTDAQANVAAAKILDLEKRLAESALDSAAAADLAATDHKTSFAQLKQIAPHIDWDTYFNEAKLPKIELSVAEPKYLAQLEQEFKDTPVATWKLYLKWQLLDSAAPSLSQAFVEESFNFKDKFLANAAELKSRSQRCVESTDALLADPLAQKYVQAYFPPSSKAKAMEVVGNLKLQIKELIAAAAWMEPQTKKKSLDKLMATDIQIGYPDTWRDYSGVKIHRDAFWENVVAGRRFNVDDNRRQVGKPTNRDAWRVSPSSPDSYIILEINTMVLTAGTLQPPFFNPDASDAVNYGAMGIAVAHDLTHAIDATGAAVDASPQLVERERSSGFRRAQPMPGRSIRGLLHRTGGSPQWQASARRNRCRSRGRSHRLLGAAEIHAHPPRAHHRWFHTGATVFHFLGPDQRTRHAHRGATAVGQRRSAPGAEVPGDRSLFQHAGISASVFLQGRRAHGAAARTALRDLVNLRH